MPFSVSLFLHWICIYSSSTFTTVFLSCAYVAITHVWQQIVVTVSDTKPVSLKLITLPRDEFVIGGESMAIQNTACYYGRHFGCVTMIRNPDCTRCADRLTHAVNVGSLTNSANQLHETAMSSAEAHLNTAKFCRDGITARHPLWQGMGELSSPLNN